MSKHVLKFFTNAVKLFKVNSDFGIVKLSLLDWFSQLLEVGDADLKLLGGSLFSSWFVEPFNCLIDLRQELFFL